MSENRKSRAKDQRGKTSERSVLPVAFVPLIESAKGAKIIK